MAEYFGEQIRRRADEEGLDISGFKRRDLEYVEGREKLNYRCQLSSGEFFEATEDNGEAKFVILRNGQEIFNFKDLVPKEFKFVTPQYWLNLNEFDKDAPSAFREDPAGYRREMQGEWQCGANFISVGEVTSLRDILSLLHEIGHYYEDFSTLGDSKKESDKKEAAKLSSKSERGAWAYALNSARKINKDLKVDLFEGFPDKEKLKEYIYTCLSTHRYMAELESSGVLRVALDILGIKPINHKNMKWLDDLFDKRKLIKK